MKVICPACSTALLVEDSFAGKKVRCGSCRAVVHVPQADLPQATLATAPIPPPPPPPPLPQRRDPQEPPRRHRDSEDESPRPNWALIGVLAGAGGLLLLVLGAFGMWLALRPAAVPPVAAVPPLGKPPFEEEKPKQLPPPVENDDPFPPRVRPRPPKPIDFGEEKPDPVAKATAWPVAFVDGKFAANLSFADADFPVKGHRYVYEFEVEAKADTIYTVETKGGDRLQVKATGPAGPIDNPKDDWRERPGMAFLVEKAGKHTVAVQAGGFDRKACSLVIRELGPGQMPPAGLRLPPPTLEILQLAESQKLELGGRRGWGSVRAAFAPDGKSVWVASTESGLWQFSSPDGEAKGSFASKNGFTVLGVDSRGRVYGQPSTGERFPRFDREQPVASIQVWDKLEAGGEKKDLPAPSRTFPIKGVVKRFIPSKDGKWLFYLDTHNRKLTRIDTEKGEIDKSLDLGPSVKSFCRTPDGKKLYACSSSNRIDEVDAEKLELVRSVRLDKGQPVDIAATDSGVCYLAASIPDSFGHKSNGAVVDLGRTTGEKAEVAGLGIWCVTVSAAMLPDGRAALLSGDRRTNPCMVVPRPGAQGTPHKEAIYERMGSELWVSPDGRTILTDAGVLISVSK